MSVVISSIKKEKEINSYRAIVSYVEMVMRKEFSIREYVEQCLEEVSYRYLQKTFRPREKHEQRF